MAEHPWNILRVMMSLAKAEGPALVSVTWPHQPCFGWALLVGVTQGGISLADPCHPVLGFPWLSHPILCWNFLG